MKIRLSFPSLQSSALSGQLAPPAQDQLLLDLQGRLVRPGQRVRPERKEWKVQPDLPGQQVRLAPQEHKALKVQPDRPGQQVRQVRQAFKAQPVRLVLQECRGLKVQQGQQVPPGRPALPVQHQLLPGQQVRPGRQAWLVPPDRPGQLALKVRLALQVQQEQLG